MKILQVNKFYYSKGGSETHFFGLKKILEKNNHQVIVFAVENKKNISQGNGEYFTREIAMKLTNLKDVFNIFYNYQAILKLKEIILKEKPDVAHLHNISHHFSPAIIKVLKKYNIPVAMTAHDYKIICPNYKLFNQQGICEKCVGGKYYQCTLNKCVKKSYLGSLLMTLEAYWSKWKKYYEYVDVFIAPSQFLRNKLIKDGYKQEKIKYIPNFLEQKISSDQEKEFKEGGYILFSGRLSAEKGVDTLIKALAKIKDKRIQLKIAGDGEKFLNLKNLAKELKIEERVKFLGHQSSAEVMDLIKKSKFMVVPSLWHENASYSVLESYSQGKVVIGSNLGGTREVVLDNKTGLIFKSGDVDDLAKKMDYLLSKPLKLREMGELGQRLIQNKLNQDKYYKKILKIYQDLIDKKTAPERTQNKLTKK